MAISTLKVEAGLIPSIQKVQLKSYIHFTLSLETEQANEKKWLSHSFYLRLTVPTDDSFHYHAKKKCCCVLPGQCQKLSRLSFWNVVMHPLETKPNTFLRCQTKQFVFLKRGMGVEQRIQETVITFFKYYGKYGDGRGKP